MPLPKERRRILDGEVFFSFWAPICLGWERETVDYFLFIFLRASRCRLLFQVDYTMVCRHTARRQIEWEGFGSCLYAMTMSEVACHACRALLFNIWCKKLFHHVVTMRLFTRFFANRKPCRFSFARSAPVRYWDWFLKSFSAPPFSFHAFSWMLESHFPSETMKPQ